MGLKTWFIATRPWSFEMTWVSVTLGAILAFRDGYFNLVLYLVSLLGLVMAHAASNMVNDYFDVKHGVDKVDTPTSKYRPHPLLMGVLKRRSYLAVIVLFYSIGLATAMYLTVLRGFLVIILTLLGLFLGVFYTMDPISYKHLSAGEIAVFLAWGPLMVGGTYFVIAGSFLLIPVLVSVPVGLLVALVLLANNLRDIAYDESVEVVTLASRLGKEAGLRAYNALIIFVYSSLLVLVVWSLLSVWSLLPMLTLPGAWKIMQMFKEEIPVSADPLTAQITLRFGILLIAGEILNVFIPFKL